MTDVLHEEVTQGDELSAVTASGLRVSSSSTDGMPPVSKKGPDAGHGNRFQSKLLMLFCIRAINEGYKFYLGTELLDQGIKFDDLIFKYTKEEDSGNGGENWPYQYLQAKSRLNEKRDTITAEDLFRVQTKEQKKRGIQINTDFSLPKYFGSYREITRRGDEIETCIICTNIDFTNEESLKKKGIKIKEAQLIDPILKFERLSGGKIPNRYKLEIESEDQIKKLKEVSTSVKDEEIHGFLDKLIFAVNTPNEGELDDVLKRDVGNYFTLLTADLQSAYVMNEMVNWFKRKDNVWLSSQEAKTLFLDKTTNIMESIRANAISIDYRNQLKKDLMGLEFNSDSIQVMTEKLVQLFKDTSSPLIIIDSESPQHTAVKLIASIKTIPDFKCDDSFLVTPSKRLDDEMEVQQFKNCLELNKDSLLVVVCDGEVTAQNYTKFAGLIPDRRTDNKINKVVIISADKSSVITDEIQYTELTNEFQQKILSREVSFQLRDFPTVRELIGDKVEEVIDSDSIKELTQIGRKLIIPSFDDPTHFDEQMYIKRKLKSPFRDTFEDEVAKRLDCSITQLRGECRISRDGHIEWLVEDERKKEIWGKINDVANQSSSSGIIHEDDDHLIRLTEDGKEKSIVIISGVAGTGKSTVLSHCYQQIKTAKPDCWVIRINLVDHYEAISKLDNVTPSNAVDFFVKVHVVDDQSSFSRSLLRKRLETGDRIVVMFDGFDEVNDLCQDNAIHLMKVITENKSIQLYVTTRPHMLDKLQFHLAQLSHSLANFERNDQIDFLTKYWKKELDLSSVKDDPIQQFAESLVDQVSETLKDKESSLIGIPLQCRIIAECFQSEVSALGGNDVEKRVKKLTADLLDGQRFDLANLYRRLMETKRRIFLEEKAKMPSSSVNNDIVDAAIERLLQDVEDHLTKLAIETLVTDHESLETLLQPQSSHRSDEDVANRENIIATIGLKFGLTFKNGANTKAQFLHRTYAEYLFARYLYEGFLLDEKRHNKLLENEPVRMLILKKILARAEYDGVQLFFNSMLKDLVDGDGEWRVKIGRRDLPERLKKFTEHFYNQFLPEDSPPQVPDAEVSGGCSWTAKANQRFDFENALHFSLWTGKTTIFTFLCDCLDATLDRKQIRIVMMKSFMQGSYFSFAFFNKTKSKLFKRFIDYVDSEADEVMSKLTTFSCNLPPSDLEYSQWDGEEQKETVHHLLEFMRDRREAFDNNFSYRELIWEPMLIFFIFNKNYESHLHIFLGLLSRSTTYSEDSAFNYLLKKVFCSKEHFTGDRIEKVLITLRELNRQNLLIQLYGIVLAIEPQSFQRIYQPPPLVEDSVGNEVKSMDLNILTERDSYRMTRLHRAAFHGNTKAVEEMLGRIRQNLTHPEHKNVAGKIINEVIARDEHGFTPFYVSAVRGQEVIYHKMLAFLKEILPGEILEKHWAATNGFVHRSLCDAIESENIEMFNLILRAVKKELGQNKLLQILRLQKSGYSSSFVSACYKTKRLFYAMANVVMRKDSVVDDTDYKTDFFKLVCEAGLTTNITQYILIEKHQLTLKDFDDFTKDF